MQLRRACVLQAPAQWGAPRSSAKRAYGRSRFCQRNDQKKHEVVSCTNHGFSGVRIAECCIPMYFPLFGRDECVPDRSFRSYRIVTVQMYFRVIYSGITQYYMDTGKKE